MRAARDGIFVESLRRSEITAHAIVSIVSASRDDNADDAFEFADCFEVRS